MSHAKITLRPPPNVDYVQGFPGIPPSAPDRPQAAVIGTIELRLGAQPAKAKWVRIEFRKVETLPGGGQNVFYDHVGQSPVNVWQAREEYDLLQTQDFPFYIRIPESIPPTISLDKGANIRYELIASVCLKGKKGLLRRAASLTLATTAPVVIDKHELHSTWPVYAQPESRHVTSDALRLTVDRTNTCYGPGDRVAVLATVRSDGLSTIELRAYEFALKETTIFRAGLYTVGKKGGPQVKVSIIGEQKVPVNTTLYGGTQHKAELACIVPPNHLTSTVTAARHIDVTYTLHIIAVMANGKPLIMDLPVTITNWPRNTSMDAIKRIGTAPNLSLTPIGGVVNQQRSGLVEMSDSSYGYGYLGSGTVPTSTSYGQRSTGRASSFGLSHPDGPVMTISTQTMPPSRDMHEFGAGLHQASRSATFPNHISTTPSQVSASVRPSTAGSTHSSRFDEISEAEQRLASFKPYHTYDTVDEEKRRMERQFGDNNGSAEDSQASTTRPTGSSRTPWPTAEDEKTRLFEKAKADVERVQGVTMPADPVPATSQTNGPLRKSSIRSSGTPWPTSEEEKMRLFDKAQALARKTQSRALMQSSPVGSSSASKQHGKNGSVSSTMSVPRVGSFSQVNEKGSAAGLSPGVALYSQAISSLNGTVQAKYTLVAEGKSSPQTTTSNPVSQYPTAEEEKAMLRYQEAKRAVSQHQNTYFASGESTTEQFGDVPSYGSSSGSQPAPPTVEPAYQQPGVFISSGHFESALDEKKRMRRAFEEQDAAVASGPIPAYSSGPMNGGSYSNFPLNGPLAFTPPPTSNIQMPSEKEQLRRMYEAQDAAVLAGPSAPPAFSSHHAVASPSPSFTAPSSDAWSSAEKEHLRKWFQQQDAAAAGTHPPFLPQSIQPSPPLPTSDMRALAEKEQLRKRFDGFDASPRPPQPPPRSGPSPPPMPATLTIAPLRPAPSRFIPVPPVTLGGVRPLTAAEEKARIEAHYRMQDGQPDAGRPAAQANPSTVPLSPSPPPSRNSVLTRDPTISQGKRKATNESLAPPPPPPLLPRPPADYIYQTQEEDARIRARLATVGTDFIQESIDLDPSYNTQLPEDYPLPLSRAPSRVPSSYGVGLPPPLPPKVPTAE